MKPKTHANITRLAIERYKRGNASSLSKKLEDHRFSHALIRGAKSEDAATPSRALNWHFYASNEHLRDHRHIILKTPKVAVYPTSERIFAKRQEKFLPEVKQSLNAQVFSLFGRILHHIQDMSTPSHVVPIYHGPVKSDPFETFLEKHWSRLNRNLRSTWLDIPLQNTQLDNFLGIYHQAAKRLLSYIDSNESVFSLTVDGAPATRQQSEIWQPYSQITNEGSSGLLKIKGFGSFGPIGKNFGETSFSEKESNYQFSEDAYLQIAEKYLSDAVADSVQALLGFEKLIEESF